MESAAVYADEVWPRISVKMVRASLARKQRRDSTGMIRMSFADDLEVDLELIRVPQRGAAQWATRIRCPNDECQRPSSVVGHHPSVGWGCRYCKVWYYRSARQRQDSNSIDKEIEHEREHFVS